MSDRLRYIEPVTRAFPEGIAEALRRTATALDNADDRRGTHWYASLISSNDGGDDALAWSQVALLIADVADVDSLTLRAMAISVDKGGQDVLPGF